MGRRDSTLRYCCPGGKVERGEKLVAAVLRELFEETSIVGEYDSVEHLFFVEPHEKIIHTLLIRDWTGRAYNVEPKKHKPWEWLDELPLFVVDGVDIARGLYLEQMALAKARRRAA